MNQNFFKCGINEILLPWNWSRMIYRRKKFFVIPIFFSENSSFFCMCTLIQRIWLDNRKFFKLRKNFLEQYVKMLLFTIHPQHLEKRNNENVNGWMNENIYKAENSFQLQKKKNRELKNGGFIWNTKTVVNK